MESSRIIKGILLSFVFLSVFSFAIYCSQIFFESPLSKQAKSAFLGSVSGTVENVYQPIESMDINAESAISVASNLLSPDKVIFQKNSGLQLPIASLTKLMSAVIVVDNYNLSQEIIISKQADLQAPMKQDIKAGEIYPVKNLLEIMLIESSNKAGYALSEKIGEQKFVSLMNQRAGEIGMQNTFFADPTGLSDKNVSSAEDLVKLAEYIIKKYPAITDISRTEEIVFPNIGKITNTNELLGQVPEIVCGKTGFTTAAKGCLLLVINNPKNNDYLINVILGSDDRFLEMKKIVASICK